jgi:Ser/Thr protein kinase RdoA (MazF antagonist)
VQDHFFPDDAVVFCKLLKSGINDTYSVQCSSGRFVLRIYTHGWRTPLAIEEELKLLQLLHGAQLPVSVPVAHTGGQYILPIDAPEGERYAVLFTHAPGRKMQQFPAELHRQVGILLARMHQTTGGLELNRPDYDAESLLIQPLHHIANHLPNHTPEMQWLQRTQHHLLPLLQAAETSDLPKGIVHLDVWFDNINITEDGRVTLFDFDFCGNGWLCTDVAYYLMQVFYTERDTTACAQKSEAFLEGYEAIRPLTPEERAMVPTLGVSLYYFYLGVQCARFENWSSMFVNEAYLAGYVNRIVKPWYEKGFS